MKEALYYEQLDNNIVQCHLCPRECRILPDNTGLCLVRKNIVGKLYAETYGKIVTIALDPIEKKPLYHFKPGSLIFSICSYGCNLKCVFCQNYSIAHRRAPAVYYSPEQIVEMAIKEKSESIAYTYNEPLICYEYVLDTSKEAHKRKLNNVLVSNGYIKEKPMLEILPFIDAMNIDLKFIDEDGYKRLCKAKDFEGYHPVLEIIKLCNEKCLVEVTNLVITGYNDKETDMYKISEAVANISQDIPFHISRYHPAYKLDVPPPSIQTLYKFYNIAKKYLNYVYIGNIFDEKTNSTYCYKCEKKLILRSGYEIENYLTENTCFNCNAKINIVL